ncbi:MAG: aryl-sulfate sulfotransferase, partial [Bdellovibrionales bacterium]|nr:aryl-sulfate sulfotransferase [Bdellovibrionales bacterium]
MSKYKTSKRLGFEIVLGIVALAGVALFLEHGSGSHSIEPSVDSPRASFSKPYASSDKSSVVTPTEESFTEENPTEEIVNIDISQAFPGMTLYPTSGSAEILLVNIAGKIVHRWDIDADRARLLSDGSILVIHGSKWGLAREPWASLRSVVRRYSWEGKVLWEKKLPEDAHHDVQILPNGNILALYLTHVEPNELTDKRPEKLRGVQIRSDVIEEISPSGESVWKWEAHNHLSLDSCGARPCSKVTKKHLTGQDPYDWTHINTISVIPENRWFDAGDTRFRPGNIIVMARNFWQAMIVDRETKNVVWTYSGDYKGGISGGHEPVMIEKGLPGAGNILIFDNGRVSEESRLLELDPTSKKIVWLYDVGEKF